MKKSIIKNIKPFKTILLGLVLMALLIWLKIFLAKNSMRIKANILYMILIFIFYFNLMPKLISDRQQKEIEVLAKLKSTFIIEFEEWFREEIVYCIILEYCQVFN